MFRRAITRSTFTRPPGPLLLAPLLLTVKGDDRPPESFLEVDRRAPAEHPLRLAHVGPRVAHVAGTGIAVLALDRPVENPADRVCERVDARRRTCGDVEDPAARALGLACADRRLDDVVDVREVARLLAVAEDRHGVAGLDRGDEERHDRRVLRRWVLPRP